MLIVLRDPCIRQLLPGFVASSLGDGMSAVAVSWLALQIAPTDRRGTAVALAVAAYTVPGVLGTFLLARPLRGRTGGQLVTGDSALRAVALGAIAVAAALDALSLGLFVALLAMSSLLHSWGSAGTYTLLAELLPKSEHVPGNALLTICNQLGVLVGPLLASVVIAWHGAGWVIALDAASFAVLAVVCHRVAPRRERQPDAPQPSRGTGFRVMLADRQLLGLLVLTFVFYALYGPIEVGLPIHVADDLHAPASHLAWYFTAFGGGAVLGGLAAGSLRARPVWPTVGAIVIGVGAALLPVGLGAPVAVSVACFGLAGIMYGPFGAITVALFQRSPQRTPVLAARRTVMILSGPVGVGAGGVLVTTAGALPAILVSAAATLVLGVLTTAVVLLKRVH
ncbi:MFS transporter [Actinoplanes sp. NPDC051494]|uniref:MFS transporter n=1 Tax=Actinoplanes sp. NPDC051494 TaxID=3363907 RepID=UPI0037A8FDDA